MATFTDPMRAIEEAEFVANKTMQRMYVAEMKSGDVAVFTLREWHANIRDILMVLETVVPATHSIF